MTNHQKEFVIELVHLRNQVFSAPTKAEKLERLTQIFFLAARTEPKMKHDWSSKETHLDYNGKKACIDMLLRDMEFFENHDWDYATITLQFGADIFMLGSKFVDDYSEYCTLMTDLHSKAA